MELLQLGSDTQKVHCPFNPAHTMPHKTLALHITKCPDKLPNYKHCSFNFIHVMPACDIPKHEEICPNRIILDEIVYESKDVVRPVTIIEKPPTVVCDETWDDSGCGSNVVKTINQRPNFMKPAYGLTKSERKKHRIQMHAAYADVDLSYNPNININKRQDASTKNNAKIQQHNTAQEVNEKKLFIGKRPDI